MVLAGDLVWPLAERSPKPALSDICLFRAETALPFFLIRVATSLVGMVSLSPAS